MVIEKSFGAPRITKDGVTVAKEIELEDKFENMGAQMVREVASKTNDLAGDGTTTATGWPGDRQGRPEGRRGRHEPMDLKRGIDLAVEAIVERPQGPRQEGHLQRRDRPGRHDSANGDTEIGAFLAEAMQKVGNEGVITVEEARAWRPSSRSSRACSSTAGILSPYFVTNAEKMRVELRDPYVVIHEKKLSGLQAMLPLLEAVVQTGKPLGSSRRKSRARRWRRSSSTSCAAA